METQKQIVERLKQANNVLVTVSNDPSVDQLAACIGLGLVLNKLDKHAAAVYSGRTPSTIEFLQPEAMLEKTTDSLRDFIISLDKSKADKLRYKVEDRVVRIFITPYRTSINSEDLNFSQGDFNVDVVVALGVHEQKDLDQAITSHGRILHDATVVTVNNKQAAELGAINWLDETASSLSEMVTRVAEGLGKESLDEQIATALLTGVVAETERFSNEKTTAETMKVSAALMAAGANQQLVATKLEPPEPQQPNEPQTDDEESQPEPDAPLPEAAVSDDGTLRINHKDDVIERPEATPPPEGAQPPAPPSPEPAQEDTISELPAPVQPEHEYPAISQVRATGTADEPGNPMAPQQPEQPNDQGQTPSSPGNPTEEAFVSPMSLPKPEIQRHDQPILSHGEAPVQTEQPVSEPPAPTPPPYVPHTPPPEPPKPAEPAPAPTPVEPAPKPPEEPPKPAGPADEHETLADLEREVHSPHIDQSKPEPTSTSLAPAPATNTADSDTSDELNLADLQHPDGSNTRPVTDDTEDDALNAARDAVAQATAGSESRLEARQDVGSFQLGYELHPSAPPLPGDESQADEPQAPAEQQQQSVGQPQDADQAITMPLPSVSGAGQAPLPQQYGQDTPNADPNQQAPGQTPPNAPPPVPPPIMPPFGQ